MVYRVIVTKEVYVDADSWEQAKELALDGYDCIQIDEFIDDDLNDTYSYEAEEQDDGHTN